MPDCLFCRIAAGSIPAEIIYEDDLVVAFLDIGPIRPGHTQIIPRAHDPYFDDLPELIASRIVQVGQRLARSLKALSAVERVAFVFTGGDVAHVHAHVVPMHEPTDITSRRYIANEDLTFADPPAPLPGELATVANSLRDAMIR